MISSMPARTWTQEQLNFFSEIIATAIVLDSKALTEGPLSHGSHRNGFHGMETTFSILKTFKGNAPSNGRVVVHHYSLSNEESDEINSSLLQTFDSGTMHTYLLYLRKDSDQRFQPTCGENLQGLSIRVQRG